MEAIDICNNALYLIGQGISIESLTEESYEAQLCGSLYDAVFKRCLEREDWSFCRKSVIISSSDLVSSDNSPYAYAYKLPDDLIRALYIQPDNSADGVNTYEADLRFDYRNISGSRLLITSRSAPFILHYQGYVELDACPAEFVEVMEYSMASRLAAELIKGETGVNTGTSYAQRADELIKKIAAADLPVEIPVDEVTADILSLMGQIVTATLENRRRAVDFISRRYNETLLYAEELYPWSFTRKEYRCTQSTGSGVPHLYAYDLPDDFLKAMFIVPDSFEELNGNKIYSYDELFDYRIDGDEHKLITSAAAPFTLIYQAEVTDTNLIPASIKEAVKYQIAADFLTTFYKQRQSQNESNSEGVSTNDAQQYMQQAQTILSGAWAADRQVELPLDEQTKKIIALAGKLNDADLNVQRRAAQYVSSRYKDALLRIEGMHNWSFFRRSKYYSSTESGSTPHEYTVDLPDDFLSALYIMPDTFESSGGNVLYEADTLFDYRIENDGRKLIVSSAAPFTLVYQAAVTDLELVPAALKEAVNYLIASDYITSFFKQEQANGTSKLDGVSTNDAQLYLQKADAAVDAQWKADKPVELPLVPEVADVLALVGQNTVTDLTVQRRAAQYIAQRYQSVLLRIEEQNNWSFNRKEQHYDAVAGEGVPHMQAYDLPADFIKALFIVPDDFMQKDGNMLFTCDALFDYRINDSAHQLITSASAPFTLIYQAAVTDRDLIPSSIKEAAQYYIASDYITTFFKQEQVGNGVKADGVSNNDAQLYQQKADALLNTAWTADIKVYLPFDERTRRVSDLLGLSIQTQDLVEQRRFADAVSRTYPAVFKQVMRQFNWSFTRKDEVITEDYLISGAVSLPWRFTYRIPDDVEHILFLAEVKADSRIQTMARPDRFYIPFDKRNYKGQLVLVTDHKPYFAIHYQAKIEDMALLDPLIIQALDYLTASRLVYSTVEASETAANKAARNDAEHFINLAQVALNEAMVRDAQQGSYSLKQRSLPSFARARR